MQGQGNRRWVASGTDIQAPFHVRHGHDGAVGGQRVAADDQEVVGAVHIGDGKQGLVAEQLPGGQLVRELVGGGGAVALAAAQGFHEGQQGKERPVIMGGGVAEIERHRILAVGFLDVVQALSSFVQGLVPADRHPAIGSAFHRMAQAVRVVVQVLQGHGLGADMAFTERVVLVATDGQNLVTSVLDLDTAHGFAEIAGMIMRLFHP